MPLEDFIIHMYCLVDDHFQDITKNICLRARGPAPKLTDVEVITMELVGECLGLNGDLNIWTYFKQHWLSWFPKMGDRTAFVRQSANLWKIKEIIQKKMSESFEDDLHLFDGFPIPLCHIKRYKRSKNLKEAGSVGYCASKDEYYFGFTGNVLITGSGCIKGFALTPANVDERAVLPEVVGAIKGMLIADKGLISPELKDRLKAYGVNLQTPLRRNMQDDRSPLFVQRLISKRRLVETVIGQLVDRFKIQVIKARDLWHLASKVGRKLLAHTAAFVLNLEINPENPLQFEGLFI
jgi:hypothetical protein